MSVLLRADKPYGVTADGKLVHPSHPLCRQILCHESGQDVPSNLLELAGLAEKLPGAKDPTLKPRDYDLVTDAEIAAVMGAPTATPATPAAAPAPAPTVEELLATPEAQKAIQDKIDAALKVQETATKKLLADQEAATKKLLADALKTAGVGK